MWSGVQPVTGLPRSRSGASRGSRDRRRPPGSPREPSGRSSELTNIRVEDVDLDACMISIEQGKGSKDRYILFPESFRLILTAHLAANPENRYLFESRQRTKFTARRVTLATSIR
jgi:integrase